MACTRLNQSSFLAGFVLVTATLAASAAMGEDNDTVHLGAASCASSLCHGSVQPFSGSPIARNEYIIWQSDRYRNMHAKAFNKLQTQEAEVIAQKLGLKSAVDAPECLACHADHVAVQFQGERFRLDDGVTCESCHGAAGEYIDAHVEPGQSRQELLEHGLYPTWDPVARGQLCLSCHLGGEGRFISHRIMGAGHPRLSFELDTFTFLQPHHVVDEDYLERKGEVDFVRDWAIGQALASLHSLDWLLDETHGWRGIFVEPVLLDCHSCHRRMDAGRWQPRSTTRLGPGEMRLNDANLVMLPLVLSAVDSGAAARIRSLAGALHQATTRSRAETLQAARDLKAELEKVVASLRSHRFDIDDLHLILNDMGRQSAVGEFRDFVAGEQAAMAIVNLVLAFERSGLIERDSTRDVLNRLFEVVADEYEYSDQQFSKAINALIRHLDA